MIRNGKIVAALSISVKFVVNVTGITKDVYKCIE